MKTQNTNLISRGLLLSITSLLFSCSEIPFADKNEPDLSSSSDRLIFESKAEFEDLISRVNHENIHSGGQDFQVKKKEFPNFLSLSQALENNLDQLSPNFRSIPAETLVDSISELVPDMSLRLFLNDKMEIELEKTIFKVTPFGTFYTRNDNYENLLKVVSHFEKESKQNARVSSGTLAGIEGGDDVYFEDTFGGGSSQTTTTPVPSENIIYQANDFLVLAPQPQYALPKGDYQKFTNYNYGAKTAVGKIFESAFGGNSDFTQNYNTTFRLRVKLYDFNYFFYRTVGLNAKLQKKGWTGIWALTNNVKAEKLVLGWDGLLLNIKVPYSMPIGYQNFPSKKVSQEILKFTNFDLPSGNLTSVRIPFLGVQPISYSTLEKMLKKILKASYSKITKEIWTEAEQYFVSASYEIKQEHVKTYRVVFPDEIKMAISRHEISGQNINELSFVIDRFYGITYKSSNGIGTFDSFSKDVIEPTLSSAKKMYDIEAASVYGASVFLGELKGIRITKELND
ncbi:hypothetical protein [Algoriphagus confluentis]|uniref:Thiol-activated cytolysin n=1 Tax=Algoriphagus confluentis TaxID=1697556 RepID=A0ABQ6PPT3_9BACT|nr:hypothetical protein Aconfl_26030 [Algoriphagus confluentis]